MLNGKLFFASINTIRSLHLGLVMLQYTYKHGGCGVIYPLEKE